MTASSTQKRIRVSRKKRGRRYSRLAVQLIAIVFVGWLSWEIWTLFAHSTVPKSKVEGHVDLSGVGDE